MVSIEFAIQDDKYEVLELASMMHAESPRYSIFPIDADKSVGLIGELIDAPEGCLLVARDEGAIVGICWAFINEIFFSRVRVSHDLLLYIAPTHRKGSTAVRLVKAYEKWARPRGVKEFQLGVSAGIDDALAVQLYEGLGYEKIGWVLKKEVGDV